ncbi:MAG: hypothetical protein ACRC1P_05925 [Cellulosilyticaceae bacterium]
MVKKMTVRISLGLLIIGLVVGMYIFSKLSHNKAYEKGLFVTGEVNKEYAGYIC